MSYNVPEEFQEKFEKMMVVGQLTRHCLDELYLFIKPGITLLSIDKFVRDFAIEHGLVLAQEGYKGFPAACCTSVNHVICHGIPSKKVIKETDLVKVDVTFIKDGFYGDSCRTFYSKKAPIKAQRLAVVTHAAMWAGIQKALPGNTIHDIAKAIQDYAEETAASYSYEVVPDFVGHGIGTEFHTTPSVPNCLNTGCDLTIRLTPGMTFTIEPMLVTGSGDYKILNDEWTVVTRDRSLAAQFEHTIGITNDGNVVFTL